MPEQKDVHGGSATGPGGGPATITVGLGETPKRKRTKPTILQQRAAVLVAQNKPAVITGGRKNNREKFEPKPLPRKGSKLDKKKNQTKVVLTPGDKSTCKFCDNPATKIVQNDSMKCPVCDDHVAAGKRRLEAPDAQVVEKKDASQEKSTGGMIALRPDAATIAKLRTDHANQEPDTDMHLTLAFLGSDVTDWPESKKNMLLDKVRDYAENFSGMGPIKADAFAHATFNPNGTEYDPCATYIISEGKGDGINSRILQAHAAFAPHTPLDAHAVFIPHVTAGYGMKAGDLKYTGPVTFDKLQMKFAGENHEFPLATKPKKSTETKARMMALTLLTKDITATDVAAVFGNELKDMPHELDSKGVLKRKPGVHNWIDRLPAAMGAAWDRSIIYRAAIHIAAGGKDVGFAIASAKNWAQHICDTGDVKQWPGIQHVNPPSKAEACAAIALWNSMRAWTHAHPAGKKSLGVDERLSRLTNLAGVQQ